MKRRYLFAWVIILTLTAVSVFYFTSVTGNRVYVAGEESLLGICPTPWSECSLAYMPVVLHQQRATTLPEPFYGMEFVPDGDLSTVKDLRIELVLWTFSHDGTPEDWRAYLDAAQAWDIKVIAWLWPEGWSWDGTAWQIDDQARSFVQTVAGHPATFAVYALHEPYWRDCWGCGYTTAEQQALYRAIKTIADISIYSDVGSISFWTAQGEKTAFADGVCDYCGNWYYPFLEDGSYTRAELISQLTADLAVIRERAPNSKFVWGMQSYAQSGSFRIPTADEMRDLASIVYSKDVDGALWYVWWFGHLYSDFLSNHPELYPIVRKIYEDVVLPKKH